LLPLLPRPLAPRTGEVTRSSPTPRPWHPITLAGIVVFVAGTAVMAKVGWSRHHAPARAPRAIPAVAAPPTDVVAARSEPRVRLDVQTLATAAPTDARPAGMGEADARSLLRELLEALQARAYDDFVAKGSAAFKAAAPADLFQRGGTRLRERLAGGYQPTLLGHLERTGGTVWLFRLEFADQGDDALAHLRTDGWQVSGFFVEDPQSSAEEKHQHRKE
jgi:hypothetical protein